MRARLVSSLPEDRVLSRAAETFIGMQQSEETRKAYRKDLVRFDAWEAQNVSVVTAEEALAFRQFLAEESGLAVNTQARVWSTVKGYFRFLVIKGDLDKNPFEYIKGPKRPTNVAPKSPDNDDVAALVKASMDNPRRRLIIALLLNGLRASEVTGLKKSDVEKHEVEVEGETHIVTVLRVLGKGMKERLVPATTEVEEAMLAWHEYSRNHQPAAVRTSEYLIPEYNGLPLTLRQVEHAVYRTAEYAGIEGMHPHALRHHYATRLIKAGASPLHVRDLLGHASVATTQVYVRLDIADLVGAALADPRNIIGKKMLVTIKDEKVVGMYAERTA